MVPFDPSDQLYLKKAYGGDSTEVYHPIWLEPQLAGDFISDGKIIHCMSCKVVLTRVFSGAITGTV